MSYLSGCPDGGTCHHLCRERCFRVLTCGPLSIAGYPGDAWPREVVLQHAPGRVRAYGYAALSAPLRELPDRACSPLPDGDAARQEHIRGCPGAEDGVCMRVDQEEVARAAGYCGRILRRTRSDDIADWTAGITDVFGLDVEEAYDF